MESTTKVLVLANETVAGRELHAELKRLASEGPVEVYVVAPALSSRVKYFLSDVDGPRAEASERLAQSLREIAADGIQATGAVGDANPVRAFHDAVAVFTPDRVVISTHPEGRSNWLERDVVDKVRAVTSALVTHVVVDLPAAEAEAESDAAAQHKTTV